MRYHDTIQELAGDAERLEIVYQSTLKAGSDDDFKEAIDANYRSDPENLLLAAWYYRLQQTAVQTKDFVVAWAWAVPLALLTGLFFWWLSDDQYQLTIESFHGIERNSIPAVLLWAAPLAAMMILIYLSAAGQKRWGLSLLIGVVLLATAGYVSLVYPRAGAVVFQEQYLTLSTMHLPILAWAGVGLFLIASHRDPANCFAFLIKSLELFIVGGLFLIALGVFTGISMGLFEALDVHIPESVQRLFFAGGGGLIVVVATAVTYNPSVSPIEQSFDEGLSKLLALLMRVLLPLTLLVLLVYLIFIPFNYRAPFDNREVLVIYNAMQFAVILLLVGATPVNLSNTSPRMAAWLRRGIIGVATLALLVSLYALAAIIFRTAMDRLTPNRLAFMGWNVINIALLIVILIYQLRAKRGEWVQGLHRAYSLGTGAYVVWILVVIFALPWLFGQRQANVESLPVSVQRIIYEQPSPILLKCYDSPHIYLLDDGEKRWIDNIETFNDRGYVWRDVTFVTCADLRDVPDGVPIPADAGPPPQP